MNRPRDINTQLEEYSKAFDIYFSEGYMPHSLAGGDILINYIESVIDDNPQLRHQSQIWREILKDDLMTFLGLMLQVQSVCYIEQQNELLALQTFSNLPIEKKREEWKLHVFKELKKKYLPTELNVAGFDSQLRGAGHNEHDSIVFSVLEQEWEEACKHHADNTFQGVFEDRSPQWETSECSRSSVNFTMRRKVESICFRYPAIKEILIAMGREKKSKKEKEESQSIYTQPLLISQHPSCTEIERIVASDDIAHLLPTETAMLSTKETEILFYHKLACKQLQSLSNLPESSSPKSKSQSQPKPKLENGPIILCLDTSGSMEGRAEQIAQSILIQLLRIAKKEKRKCFLITFAIDIFTLEVSKPGGWRRVQEAIEHVNGGGTSSRELFWKVFEVLGNDNFGKADILIISDFQLPLPDAHILQRIEKEKEKCTCFYGLGILRNNQLPDFTTILDKIWKIFI